MPTADRWAITVRVLIGLAVFFAAAAVLEGVAARRARAELQVLRDERDRAQAGQASAWTSQPADEFRRVVTGLDDFYAEPTEGFGRAGGLCPGGRLDADPIVTYALQSYLGARAKGQSVTAALDAMTADIRRSDAYRAVHPDLAAPAAP